MKKEIEQCLIVTGGCVDLQLLDAVYHGAYGYMAHPFTIGVDKGLEALEELHIEPNIAIGDFDSANDGIRAKYVTGPDALLHSSVIKLDRRKDYTDTHAAILEALRYKPKQLLIMGATGTRLDHSLANMSLLGVCLEAGVNAQILDVHNRISLIKDTHVLRKKHLFGPYISFFPYGDYARMTLKGFEYDVTDLRICQGDSISISNEMREEEGHITVGDGYLYVMETKD